MSIAKKLCENGFDVLCCDKNPVPVHEISEIARNVVQADVTEPGILNELALGNYDIVIIAFSDDFEAELLTTMIIKEKGVPFIMTKANGIRQKKILESIGADKVVMPEIEMGERIADSLVFNDPMEHIYRSENYEIVEMSPKREWINNSLDVLNLRKDYGLNILSLIRDGNIISEFSANTVINEHDRIVALLQIKK